MTYTVWIWRLLYLSITLPIMLPQQSPGRTDDTTVAGELIRGHWAWVWSGYIALLLVLPVAGGFLDRGVGVAQGGYLAIVLLVAARGLMQTNRGDTDPNPKLSLLKARGVIVAQLIALSAGGFFSVGA